MRDRGFNMIRKHLKIEDPLQYYWADRLGMFVWQDMPHATYMNAKSNGGETPGRAVYESCIGKHAQPRLQPSVRHRRDALQ